MAKTRAAAAKSAKAPVPRSPGRPRQAQNADLRPQLLDAAIAVFVEQGVTACSLRAIATRAGVTPALLHYYFGSKDSLVSAVLDERIAPIFAHSTSPLHAPTGSPRANLLAFLERHMRNIAGHPWLPRLMVREVLSEGGVLRERMQQLFGAIMATRLLALITQGQAAGEIRADLDPRLLGLSLISLAIFPFATAPIWRNVLHTAPGELDAGQLIAHTLTVIDHALEKPRV